MQANEVCSARRILFCSGQAANDETGAAVHAGDMRTQITLTLAARALSVIAGIGLLAGMTFNVFGLFNLALTIPIAIWLIVMGWGWLRPWCAA